MKPSPSPASTPAGTSRFRSWVAPVLLGLLVIAVMRWGGDALPRVEAAVRELGPAGLLLFAGAALLLMVGCFPVAVLGVSAGALFGPWLGLPLLFGTVFVGGSLMFALGRGLLRERVRAFLATRPRLTALDKVAGDRAVRLNLLARLSPLNYGLVCYTLSAGRSGYGAYALGILGTLPSLAAQVWFGALARQAGQAADEGGRSSQLILLGAGLIFFGFLSWQIKRMADAAWAETRSGSDE